MAARNPPRLPSVQDLDESGARALGAWLALEHEHALHRSDAPGVRDERERLAAHCRSVSKHLPALARLAERVAATQWHFLEAHAGRLDDRAESGRVRAAEVACLALDLALRDRGDLAERLLSAYAGEADDFDLFGVVDFYERACALERASRIAESSSEEPGEGRAALARRLLLLAVSAGRRPLVPPVLVAVGGRVATGKSTVSRALAERLGAPRIEADAVRNAVLGDRPGRTVHEARWAESLAPGFEDRVYEELGRRAACVLGSGRPLVIAACFPRARQREAASALARRAGFPFLFVECRPDRETVLARLAARDTEKGQPGGWRAVYDALEERWQAEDALPADERIHLDTAGPVEACVARLTDRLPGWPEGRRS